ncbi:RCC1/BLIP-II protein [Piromyces finnis]|uniref:RCC1/BLIP-II protein n=1 Tax=Piromyces finnis TaxID=1754191 RepID=A0A1Y1VE84_9FUNG|nr:RCC1/BLIP-II protein [Piromyces finnis]|eukprot:ORX53414.1 RCC1/BLIP-II protein [Piromyces finnis]
MTSKNSFDMKTFLLNLSAFIKNKNEIRSIHSKTFKQLIYNYLITSEDYEIYKNNLAQVVKNEDITVFRSKDGVLFLNKNNYKKMIKLNQFKNKIIDIAISKGYIYGISENNKFYYWNYNKNYYSKKLLCIKNTDNSESTEFVVFGENNKKIEFTRIISGNGHGFLIDKEKRPWGFGLNDFTQLGVDDSSKINYPYLIKPFAKIPIIEIACGKFHSMFLSENGNIFVCGDGNNCQTNICNILCINNMKLFLNNLIINNNEISNDNTIINSREESNNYNYNYHNHKLITSNIINIDNRDNRSNISSSSSSSTCISNSDNDDNNYKRKLKFDDNINNRIIKSNKKVRFHIDNENKLNNFNNNTPNKNSSRNNNRRKSILKKK